MRSIASVPLVMACIVGVLCFQVGTAAQKEGVQASAKLDGKWYVVWQEQFGGAVPAAVAKRLSAVIDGNTMEWYIGNPAPNMAATITVDPNKKTLDAKVTRGSLNGKTMLGIYKFEDGMLHVCWAEIGAKRPEKFASTKPGGGAFEYTIYSRTKDQELKKQPATVPAGTTNMDIATLQVKLAEKWKDEGAVFGVRWFKKDKIELLAVLHPGQVPATPLELVEMTKKNANLFPAYAWVKTTGIGKLADGVFIVGNCKAANTAVGIGVARSVDGATVLFLGAPADDAATRKEMLDMVKSAQFGPEAPPDLAVKIPAGKRPKLADMKFTLPKDWEAKYSDIVTWRISHGGFEPSISVLWKVETRYEKNLDGFAKKMQDTDYFGNGMYMTNVLEKGKLPEGLYVLGKFKVGKDSKESKYTGFAIIRDFGGYQMIFESFSTSYDNAKLLKEAMDICKSAKF